MREKEHDGYVHVRLGKVHGNKVYRSRRVSLKAYEAAVEACPKGCVVSSFAYMKSRSPESCEGLEVIDASHRKIRSE